MKSLVLILMLFAFAVSHGQIKGVPFDEAVPFDEVTEYTDDEMYNTLIRIEDDDVIAYTYLYEVKGKGYYDALKQLSSILKANNITRPADIEDSYFENHVNENDYNVVVHELKMETGWIERTWFAYDDTWKIVMMGNDEVISVFVGHNKNGQFEYENQQQPERFNNLESNAFGNRSDFKASTDANRYGTGGGLGSGISFGGLGSRRPMGNLPKPNMSGCEVTQKIEVKVEIQVDREGKVISAIIQSATYQDNCIWTKAVEAAKQSRFSVDQNANYRQTGWIRYIIVP